MPPYDPPNAFYTEVPIPIYVDVLKLMGRSGNNLKKITEKSGCQYIWVDFKRSVVEIWGRECALPTGIAMVRNHISRLSPRWEQGEVRSWRQGSQVLYEVEGPPEEFLSKLREMYPFNSYMTQIVKRTCIISRFSSCD